MDVFRYVQKVMEPMKPLETGVTPTLPVLDGVDAVIFDVYGTLIISAAGDISLGRDSVSVEGMRMALERLEGFVGNTDPARLSALYETALDRHQAEERSDGVLHPEVEIRIVWRDIIAELGGEQVSEEVIEEVALIYECAVNPVWLMPGVENLLKSIESAGIPMGIISNAQFYTPPIFEALMKKSLTDLGFEQDLLIFSYEHGEGKPSLRLYEEMCQRLKQRGIEAESVFYLGNDMRKDVVPAKSIGFRSGLFAGDMRSLRTDGVDLESLSLKCDAVITELEQTALVVGLR
tara:strand:+ start:138 stop:1010 length:873 start_codon:yes stop_codon:yes gene_type:complete